MKHRVCSVHEVPKRIGIFNEVELLKCFDELWEALFWVNVKRAMRDKDYDRIQYLVV